LNTKSDPNVDAAVRHWAPRFIQNGVDYNDFVATTARVTSWDQWLPEWSLTADTHAEIARRATEQGHRLTAGHAWRRAAVCRHFGKFVWTVDLDLAAEATRRSAEEMRNALAILDPSAERIETPFGDATIVATLRQPSVPERPPLVLLLPGLDSTKEEFFFLEQLFLERGMATLSIDGPGQGETGLQLPISASYHRAVSAVLDHVLATRSGRFDADRVGLCGVSLGGFYAPLVAAHEPRVKVMVALSGPFNFAALWPDAPDVSKATFMASARVTSEEDALVLANQLDLTGLCERISARSLYVTGDKDRLVPWTQTERQAKETPNAEFVCYPGGNHAVANLPHIARPMFADWMADQLKAVE
jgi:dipeptidyl aminopeptidase/acylaminoacyl peptidase